MARPRAVSFHFLTTFSSYYRIFNRTVNLIQDEARAENTLESQQNTTTYLSPAGEGCPQTACPAAGGRSGLLAKDRGKELVAQQLVVSAGDKRYTIDVSTLPPGNYMVNITGIEGRIWKTQFVKL